MTDKLKLMLINVLLDQFLNIKVLQGSVATRLSCDGIFITQSLLSPRVKKRKLVNICLSYGQLSTGLFFNETVYIPLVRAETGLTNSTFIVLLDSVKMFIDVADHKSAPGVIFP